MSSKQQNFTLGILMADIYLPLKHTHLLLVVLSLGLFIVRGTALQMNAQWLNKKIVKIAPHVIDSVLLLTGVMLTFAVAQYPIADNWLSVKMILLVGYIVLGIKMMRSTQVMMQRSYFAGALACVLLMVTVARTHHPLGLFSLL